MAPNATKRASFGDVHFGKHVLLAFDYANTSREEQNLTHFASSKFVAAKVKGPRRLATGEHTLIVVEVATKARMGDIDEVVSLFARERQDPVAVLEVAGSIRRYVEVAPAEPLHFGTVNRGSKIWRDFIVAELVPSTVSVPETSCSPPWLEFMERSITQRGDRTRVFNYMIAVPQSAPIGRFCGEVTIRLDPKRFDPIIIPIEGEVVEEDGG